MNAPPDPGAGPELAPELLDIVVCPACHGGLAPEPAELRCTACGRRYPVREGIPVLLVDEATDPS